jgi:hypothetical protein
MVSQMSEFFIPSNPTTVVVKIAAADFNGCMTEDELQDFIGRVKAMTSVSDEMSVPAPRPAHYAGRAFG